MKYLSEHESDRRIRGVYLLATPFWPGVEDWQKGLKLRDDFASRLPKSLPLFLYQSQDDQELDPSHLAFYQSNLPQAVVRTPMTGGHQFGNDLTLVARDILGLG